MSVLDIYKFVDGLEKSIGDCCRVIVFIAFDNTLAIQVNWPEDLHYRRAISVQEMEYMKDETGLMAQIVFIAKRQYKLATVGEE